MMSAPPMRRIHSRCSSSSWPAALNEAPSATNTTEKPTTNVTAWVSTRRRIAAVRSFDRSATDLPVMKDRYDGNSGSTHGDRNENNPALKATRTPTDPRILASEPLDQGVRGVVVPVPGTDGQGGQRAVTRDNEARGQRAHAVRVGHAHRRIERHRERELAGGDEGRDQLGVGVYRYGHQREPGVTVLAVQPIHRRHLLQARRTPRRPEVDQHHLAVMVEEPELAAGGRRQREVVRTLRLRGLDEVELTDGVRNRQHAPGPGGSGRGNAGLGGTRGADGRCLARDF